MSADVRQHPSRVKSRLADTIKFAVTDTVGIDPSVLESNGMRPRRSRQTRAASSLVHTGAGADRRTPCAWEELFPTRCPRAGSCRQKVQRKARQFGFRMQRRAYRRSASFPQRARPGFRRHSKRETRHVFGRSWQKSSEGISKCLHRFAQPQRKQLKPNGTSW